MNLGTLLLYVGIFFGVSVVLFFLFSLRSRSNQGSESEPEKRGFFWRSGEAVSRGKRIIPGKRIIALLLVGIIAFFTFASSITVVASGTRGVVLRWGKIDRVLSEGLHLKLPIAERVETMDITIQKVETTEATASNDLQEVTTTIAVNYRILPELAGEVYRQLRQELEIRVIRPNIEESIKATTADFQAEELVTKRELVKIKFKQILSDRLEDYYVEILSVSIVDFKFSPEFTSAIEAKVIAEQRALEALNKLEQIRHEAQQKIIQASAEANATILTAEAEATQRLIIAEAEAEAIRLVTEQLMTDPEYLQYLYIKQWDGELPYYYGGEGLPFFLLTNSTE